MNKENGIKEILDLDTTPVGLLQAVFLYNERTCVLGEARSNRIWKYVYFNLWEKQLFLWAKIG